MTIALCIFAFFIGILIGVRLANAYILKEDISKPCIMSWNLLSINRCPEDRFFGVLKVETPCGERTFKGNGHIWMDLDKFKRCSAEEECRISDLLESTGHKWVKRLSTQEIED